MDLKIRTRKYTIRKRTQRLTSLEGKSCHWCGSTKNLQRHHRPGYKEDEYLILCMPCHAKADKLDQTRPPAKQSRCLICGAPTPFRKKTCSDKCLTEMGKINAQKRWGKK